MWFHLGGWQTVVEIPADEPLKFKVEDLVNKNQYKFRVTATNKLGTSEPCVHPKCILAKDPWGKKDIIHTLRMNMT